MQYLSVLPPRRASARRAGEGGKWGIERNERNIPDGLYVSDA